MKLALIGYGTIARIALETLGREAPGEIESLMILCKRDGADRARSLVDRVEAVLGAPLADSVRVTEAIEDVIAAKPDLAAEAAGHGALHDHGAALLKAGIPLVVASVGALADDVLRSGLDSAAGESGCSYEVIAGAVGGLDILGAVQLSGLDSVVYNSRKPPAAWRGTAAEGMIDLDAVEQEVIFMSGNAAQAASTFPQNANVAATIALKGVGFAQTRVNLIADPAVTRNVHELIVSGQSADFTIRIEGRPAPDNPKTSLTTAYSLAQTIIAAVRRV